MVKSGVSHSHVLVLVFCLLTHLSFYVSENVSLIEDVDWRQDRLAGSSNVIWVPDNYTTIQAAIYAAGAGDTIRVQNGTYHENLRVNQSVKLIGERLPTICGESVGMFGKPTVDIDTENVTICGFIIQHYPFKINERDSGISISSRGNVTGNIIHSNIEGITSGSGCNYNVISNNVIEGNGLGLRSDGAWNNITNNIVRTNGNGISIHAVGDILINNTITNNTFRGFELSVWGSKLRNNTISGNGVNFIRWDTLLSHLICDIDTSNTINGKPIYYWINQSYRTVPSDAGYVGIINCTNIKVEGLTLEHNGQGVLIAHSSNITVKNCNLTNNRWGVRLLSSSNMSIYHNNFIDNFYQYETYSENLWDNGYPSGGNYWSDYTGMDEKSGSRQNETGSDGIGDTAYGQDRYPLMGFLKCFNVSWEERSFLIDVISNFTTSSLKFSQENISISFNVATNNSVGFSRVTIPTQLLWCNTPNEWQVLADGIHIEHTILESIDDTYIYFAYANSTKAIEIKATYTIPEFKPLILLPFLLSITIIIALLEAKRKKHKLTPSHKT